MVNMAPGAVLVESSVLKLYRKIYLPNHILATKRGYAAAHRVALYRKIGPGPHKCHWCGTPVDWKARGIGKGGWEGVLVADHVNGDLSDNSGDNLVPSCAECNALREHVPAPRQTVSCEICGSPFEIYTSRRKINPK